MHTAHQLSAISGIYQNVEYLKLVDEIQRAVLQKEVIFRIEKDLLRY